MHALPDRPSRPAPQAPAVEDARERLVMLQSVISEAVILEVDGIVEWASSSLEGLVGWLPAELVGRRTELVWDPFDDHVVPGLRAAALAGEPNEVVCRLRDAGGAPVWASVRATPWITPDDRDGIVLRICDYRPLHRATGALIELQRRIDALTQAYGQQPS